MNDRNCSVVEDGVRCHRIPRTATSDLCNTHYERKRRHGTVYLKPKRVCSVPKCHRPHEGRGFCSMHLSRWTRNGTTDLIVKTPKGTVLPYIETAVPLMTPDTCHTEWPFSKASRDGRPAVEIKGKRMGAVKYAWKVLYGYWPRPEMWLLHTCHVGHCWNPHHVYEGTREDNTDDMMKAGRGHWPGNARGSRQGNAKLTEDDVRVIRQRVSNGERQRRVAAEYGIGVSSISSIVNRLQWRHVI